ncbi:MAG: hypothetical protein EOP82_04515 [Variovorax sp.]|nr:MAG: hypothetical protein EOP82_04515 [Variovorax sp.]
MIDVADDALPFIRSGKLHALAATGSRRVKSLPEVQTVAESGLRGFHVALWFGAAVRADTPPPVATRRTAINRMMLDPAFLGAIAAQSMQAQPLQSEGELRRYVERDGMRWGKVIREHNVRLDAPER